MCIRDSARMDRFDTQSASERTYLYFLGLFPPTLANQLRPAHRPPPAQRHSGAATEDRWRRYLGTRPGGRERSCTDVDYAWRRGGNCTEKDAREVCRVMICRSI